MFGTQHRNSACQNDDVTLVRDDTVQISFRRCYHQLYDDPYPWLVGQLVEADLLLNITS